MVADRSDQRTDIAVVPADWSVRRLSDLLDFRNGFNADSSAYGSGLPFINVLEVITRSHIKAGDIPGRVDLPPTLLDAYVVRRGDVLFNRTSETQDEVGLAAVYDDDESVTFGGFVIRGRPRDTTLDPDFAGYALRSSAIRAQMVARGQGAIHSNIGQAELAQVVVVFPPMREQRAIAGALVDVDLSMRALERLVDKRRGLRDAAAHQLLSGSVRLPGFADDWETVAIDNVTRRRTGAWGQADASSTNPKELAIVTVGDISPDGRLTGTSRRFLSDAEFTAARSTPGDVLFAASGEPGKTWINDGRQEVGAANFLRLLEPIPGRIAGPYLYYALRTTLAKNVIRAATTSSVIGNIQSSFFAAPWLPLPPFDEQLAISSCLLDMDAEIEALEARLAKTRDLKTAMAQALLSGRTRLV